MDARRRGRGRHAEHRDEQGVADDAERHAERAVDQLRREADQDEGKERRKIDGRQIDHEIIPTVLVDNRLPVFARIR